MVKTGALDSAVKQVCYGKNNPEGKEEEEYRTKYDKWNSTYHGTASWQSSLNQIDHSVSELGLTYNAIHKTLAEQNSKWNSQCFVTPREPNKQTQHHFNFTRPALNWYPPPPMIILTDKEN